MVKGARDYVLLVHFGCKDLKKLKFYFMNVFYIKKKGA